MCGCCLGGVCVCSSWEGRCGVVLGRRGVCCFFGERGVCVVLGRRGLYFCLGERGVCAVLGVHSHDLTKLEGRLTAQESFTRSATATCTQEINQPTLKGHMPAA